MAEGVGQVGDKKWSLGEDLFVRRTIQTKIGHCSKLQSTLKLDSSEFFYWNFKALGYPPQRYFLVVFLRFLTR